MHAEKRTKIVCTIGPASHEPAMLLSMMQAGMDVARLNFSHGTHADHAQLAKHVRQMAVIADKPIAILADLQGPKIRLGILPESGLELKTGSTVVFSTAISSSHDGVLPVTYKGLHRDVKVGHRMLIDDGLIDVTVTKIQGKELWAKVIHGGHVSSHKGMNLPDSTLKVSPLTTKDRADAAFAVKLNADWVALSFVTHADDVRTLRRILTRAAGSRHTVPRIIVKIEKHEAIDCFEEILAVADGVMVARGDLGVEILAEEVPIRQKAIIDLCRRAGKPVVVATQMLDSMIRNPRPTRAEVSDVANAVFDHTDAVMLSGESASGLYPLETVQMMARIIREAEASPYDDVVSFRERPPALEASVARAIKTLASEHHIDGVLAALSLASWAETLHRSHPEIPLFLGTSSETSMRQNNLRWGARPFLCSATEPKVFLRRALKQLKEKGWIHAGMRLAVVLGAEHGKGFDLIEV